jgi:hypothetical protein
MAIYIFRKRIPVNRASQLSHVYAKRRWNKLPSNVNHITALSLALLCLSSYPNILHSTSSTVRVLCGEWSSQDAIYIFSFSVGTYGLRARLLWRVRSSCRRWTQRRLPTRKIPIRRVLTRGYWTLRSTRTLPGDRVAMEPEVNQDVDERHNIVHVLMREELQDIVTFPMWLLKLSVVDGKELSHSIGGLMDPSAGLHVSVKNLLFLPRIES